MELPAPKGDNLYSDTSKFGCIPGTDAGNTRDSVNNEKIGRH